MIRSLRSLSILIGALALVATAAPLSAQRGIGVGLANAPGLNQPVRVDCSQGDSLQAALDSVPQNQAQITIDIHGFCAEQITIERKVIIRGADPQNDGITGAPLGNNTALVVVFGVKGFGLIGSETVRFEHLTIKDSSNIGVSVNASQLGLTDVTIRNNGNIGLGAFQASFVAATSLTAADNIGAGLFSRGNLSCANCVVSGNGGVSGAGIGADQAGKIVLVNTSLTGTRGLQATSSGEVTMISGTIVAAQRAATVVSGGHVFFQDGTQVTGSVACGLQGILDSRRGTGTAGMTQISNASGGNNLITNGCFFLAGPGTTTLTGNTFVTAGGYVGIEGGAAGTTVKFNALACSSGGKVTGATITVNNVPGIPAGCGT